MRLGWVRGSDVSSGRQTLRTHFLPIDQVIMQLGWGRENIVSMARMVPWTDFSAPLASTAKSFSASSQSQNANWGKSRKRSYRGLMILCTLFLSSPSQIATCLKSIKRFFKFSNGILKAFSASCQAQNAILLRSRKRCFKCYHDPLKSFRSLDQLKFSLWCVRESDVSIVPMVLWTKFLHLWPDKNSTCVSSRNDVASSALQFQLIFCLLSSPNCDLGEVEKT